jgi:hypothetical protein
MPATVIVITNASLKLADDPTGLTTAPDFQCQVNSAAINANANLQTVAATFCSPEAQVPAATGYELALTFLQDWTDATGLSFYLFENDTMEKYFSLSLDDQTAPLAEGVLRCVAGAYGGDAGTPLQADVVLPIQGKPTITKPTGALVA